MGMFGGWNNVSPFDQWVWQQKQERSEEWSYLDNGYNTQCVRNIATFLGVDPLAVGFVLAEYGHQHETSDMVMSIRRIERNPYLLSTPIKQMNEQLAQIKAHFGVR